MDFIIFHLEYDAGMTAASPVLAWVDAAMKANPDRRAIVSTHHLTGIGEPSSFGSQGQAIFDALEDNENLFLMLGGHVHGEGLRQDTGSNGNVIYSVLSDYQELTNGGDGWLRIMEFSPVNDRSPSRRIRPHTTRSVRVPRWGPVRLPNPSSSRTTCPTTLSRSRRCLGVASGANASVTWSDLEADTEYEWYVVVDDGNGGSTPSATYTFTTGTTPGPQVVSFQQDVDEYAGTVDTWLEEENPTTDYSDSLFLTVDSDPLRKEILLRFDDVIGTDAGQVPPDATVVSATLGINVTDASTDGAELFRMLETWSDSDTFDSMGGGISIDGTQAAATADSSSPGSPIAPAFVDVTLDVQAWASGAANYGWGWVQTTGTSGWGFDSAEGTVPPVLTVEYFDPVVTEAPTTPTGLTVDVASPTSLDISWDHVFGEDSFELLWSEGGVGQPDIDLGANVTSYSHTSLTSDVEYCYQVQATNTFGSSTPSAPVCGTPADVSWTASFNDFAWGSGQLDGNITKFTAPGGGGIGLPSAGSLVDVLTGLDTGVSLSVSGGSYTGGNQTTDGENAVAGSDAHAVFDGIVSTEGAVSYVNPVVPSPAGDLVVTLSGLDPTHTYDVVYNADRGDYTWAARAFLVTLSGANGFVNVSSAATDNNGVPLFSGPGDGSTRLPPNNPTGWVARWNGVDPGPDGVVELVVSYDGDPAAGAVDKGKYASALALFDEGVNLSPSVLFDKRVAAGPDDAEERDSDGVMDLTSSDLEMVHDGNDASDVDQLIGMRFQDVAIPAGATIRSAQIEFVAAEDTPGASLMVFGEAAGNAPEYTITPYDISGRDLTTESMAWTTGPWLDSRSYSTTDLSAVVQEIVDLGGWSSGNAMAFVVDGDPGDQVRAESFTGTNAGGDAPLLVVQYSVPSGPAIVVSGTPLAAFTGELGVPSDVQSYSVSGSLLTENIVVTAPADFEVSLAADSGFAGSVLLPESSGTVAATPVYVRMLAASEGALGGDITHTSAGATTRTVAVSGTVPLSEWVAFNAMTSDGSGNAENVTSIEYDESGSLVDFESGLVLPVTVTGSFVGDYEPHTSGVPADPGTDAYDAFHGIVDLNASNELDYPTEENTVTFDGLDTEKTYSITLTANRGNVDYGRWAKVSIDGVEAAIDESSTAPPPGVATNGDGSRAFSAGYNTVNGYVVKWTGIDPGDDGSFSVTSMWDSERGTQPVNPGEEGPNDKGYSMAALKLETETTPPYRFSVNPVGNQVWGDGWTPGSVVVSIGGLSWPAVADSGGHFDLDLNGYYDIVEGDVVVVSDTGLLLKDHEVTGLSVAGVIVVDDEVTGTAVEGSLVWVNVHGSADPDVVVPADFDVYGDGSAWVWTAGFPTGSIDDETQGYAYQLDGDGDQTQVDWPVQVPEPPHSFGVDPVNDQVFGWGWPAGGSVLVEVFDVGWNGTDPALRTYPGVVVAGDSNFNLDLTADPAFDVAPGMYVVVSDESGVFWDKDHVVTDVAFTEIDAGFDVVSGTASAVLPVWVNVHGSGFEDTEAVLVGGEWDAAMPFDIDVDAQGYVYQRDPDGDRTHIDWPPPYRFSVNPVGNQVWGDGWTPGSVVVSIGGLSWPAVADSGGHFDLDLNGYYDIVEGDVVVVSDTGLLLKDHEVTGLSVAGVIVVDDEVTGTAVEGSLVWVNVHGSADPDVVVPADFDVYGDGSAWVWTAGFPTGSIDDETQGYAYQLDGDGDQTQVDWPVQVPEPPHSFGVDPVNDQVFGWGWPAGGSVLVEVFDVGWNGTDPALRTYPGVVVAGDSNFNLDLTADPAFDVAPGMYVVVSDESGVFWDKDHVVTDVAFTEIDAGFDVVSGTASAVLPVWVNVHGSGFEDTEAVLVGGEWDAAMPFDIDVDAQGYVYQRDPDGDRTHIDWPPPYRFSVNPVGNQVWGDGWTPGSVVVSIGGLSWPAVADSGGHFDLDLNGYYDIVEGDVVVVSDTGLLLKDHEVTGLSVAGVIVVDDEVTGTAVEGSLVWVNVHGSADPDVVVPADFDVYGDGSAWVWTAGFPTGSIDDETQGYAYQLDGDGDQTQVDWPVQVPEPPHSFGVDPVNDQVFGWGWPAGGSVLVEVFDVGWNGTDPALRTYPGVVVAGDSNFNLDLTADPAFDVAPGMYVVVSDESGVFWDKDHVVTDVAFTEIDAGFDVVSGTASAVLPVWVNVHGSGFEDTEAVLVGGEWDATMPFDIDVDAQGYVYQRDPDGDRTHIDWPPPYRFSVNPVGNQVWGDGWTPGSVVVSIGGLSWPAVADSGGHFDLDLNGYYDIVEGDVVVVSDTGLLLKDHEVTGLSVAGVIVVDDEVTGTAVEGSLVWVNVHGSADPDVVVPADFDVYGDGSAWVWTAGFPTGSIDDETQGYAYQLDGDGDQTQVDWPVQVPEPPHSFGVDPVNDQVFGWGWPAGGSVLVEVFDVGWNGTDPALRTYPGVVVAGDSNFNLDLTADPAFDVAPGMYVVVSDESGVFWDKDHVVTDVAFTEIDAGFDVVSGTASAVLPVWVNVHGSGFEDTEAVLVGGEWDATMPFDIDVDAQGYVYQRDPDGDRTHIDWPPPYRFSVNPVGNQVWGDEWTPGSVVVSIGGLSWPAVADSGGHFDLDLNGYYNIVEGDVVVVSDTGLLLKDHEVTGLSVAGVIVVDDEVTGTAVEGSLVWVNVHGSADPDVVVPADFDVYGDGSAWVWTAGFPTGSIDDETQGYAYQLDGDGDQTQVDWPVQVPEPPHSFGVDPVNDQVFGWGWPAGGSVLVEVFDVGWNGTDPALRTYPGVVVAGDSNFNLDLTADPAFDVAPGMYVVVSDESGVFWDKDHVVTDVAFTEIDAGFDVVSGTASAVLPVWVNVHGSGFEDTEAVLVGGEWDATMPFDIDVDAQGYVYQRDPDGDRTHIDWPAVPAIPSGLTVDVVSDSELLVSWDDVESETGYDLEVGPSGGAYAPVDGSPFGEDETSVLDTGLTAGTEYCYVVQAVNFGGGSGFSTEVCGVPEVQTNWTAFIDLRSSDGDQNAPNVLEIAEGTAGTPINPLTVFDLIDIDSGATVGATLRVDNSGIDVSSDDGGPFTAGPAFDVFDGIVDPAGVYSFSDPDDVWQLNFAGLNPSMRYEIVLSTNAATPASPEAWTDVSLGSAPYLVEASGGSTTVVSSGQVRFESEDNTVRGDVARWVTINPGDDGTFRIDSSLFVPAGVTDSLAPVAVMLREFTPVESDGPVLVVDVPTNGEMVAESSVVFDGSASDDVGVTRVALAVYDRELSQYWDGAVWQSGYRTVDAVLDAAGAVSTDWSYPFNPAAVSSQPYWFQVRAYDAAGNMSNTVEGNFTLGADVEDPVVVVDVPTNGEMVAESSLVFDGSASDDVGVTRVALAVYDRELSQYWDGAGWLSGYRTVDAVLDAAGAVSTDWSYPFNPAAVSSQPYWFQVRAYDAAGKTSNTIERNFTLGADVEDPVVVVDVPTNGEMVAASSLVFDGSASDDVGVTRVALAVYDRELSQYWDGAGWLSGYRTVDAVLDAAGAVSTDWSYPFNPAAVSSQPYWFQVRAYDAAGKTSNTVERQLHAGCRC